MVLDKYFKKFPVHSQIQMVPSRVVCRRKPFLQLIVKRWDRFTNTQGRTVRPSTWLRGPHSSFSTTKTSLLPLRVNPYPGAMVPHDVRCWNAKLWRCECYATCPQCYLFMQFLRNWILPLICEIFSPRFLNGMRGLDVLGMWKMRKVCRSECMAFSV